MDLKKEIKRNNFEVEQRLIYYSVGERLNIYNLKAIAKQSGCNRSELVQDTYGLCFDEELNEICWFLPFESKARHIYIMRKTFQKAYSKLNCSFPEFKAVFSKYHIDPKDMFLTLQLNGGKVENFILVEYDEYEERCRFYKEHSNYAEKWMPHLEPFNHKKHMITDKEYDIEKLYNYLQKRHGVVIPQGIIEEQDIFQDEIVRYLDFYVKIDNAVDAKRDFFEDLPKSAIDISPFKYPPLKIKANIDGD